MKRLLFIILILMLAWNAYAIPPTPPVAAGDGSGDVLAGTMGSTGQYCTKNAATKTIDCNTTPSYQAALDIAKGTYTNTYLCKYTSSGTLLDCNVDPAGFQTANATLTALAAQTESQGALQYYTADATPAVLAKGTAYQLLQMNSGATAPEWTSSLSISALNLTSATSSIPWVVGTSSWPTAEGSAKWDSTNNLLYIGDGSTSQKFVPMGTLTDTKYCTYNTATGVTCAADGGGGTGDLKADGTVAMTAALVPNAANTIALGSTSAEWADIYLGDGAIIYGQNDQSNTITSSATGWSFAKPITVADASNDNYIKITNNSGGREPTASVYEIYPDAGVWKINTNGTEATLAILGANTFTAKQTMDATTGVQVGATGVLITSDDDGAITFLGASAGYDEDLTINLDDTENTAVVSSSTGVTKIDYGSIGSATTGTISGGTLTPVIDDPDNFASNFTGANLYGGTFIANAAGTAALPNAAVGMNFTIVLETTGDTILEPLATGTDDTIYMNGLAAAQGEYIHSTTRGAMCVFQYRAADTWMATCNGFTEATPP